jgi:hypothetical protein
MRGISTLDKNMKDQSEVETLLRVLDGIGVGFEGMKIKPRDHHQRQVGRGLTRGPHTHNTAQEG